MWHDDVTKPNLRPHRSEPKGLSGIGRLLHVDEVLEHLNVSKQQLARLIREQNLPCVNQDGVLRFDPEQLDAWHALKQGAEEDQPGDLPRPEPYLFHEHNGRLALTVFDREAAVRDARGLDAALQTIGVRKDVEVRRALDAENQPVVIGDLPACLRGQVNILVTRDRLKAYVYLSPGASEARTAGSAWLLARLASMGITQGLRHDVINSVSNARAAGRLLLVAHGVLPQSSGKPQVEYSFDTRASFKPKMLEDPDCPPLSTLGVTAVCKGDVLAQIKIPGDVINGVDVFGHPVRYTSWAAGLITAGSKTYTSRGGLRLHASCDGVAYWKRGAACVDPVRIYPELTQDTADIRFDGRLIVHKNVKNAGVVDASKKLIILGRAENTSLTSRTSSVNVHEGINGGGRAKITAASSIRTGFAENCTLTAGHDVIVKYSLNNCTVHAARRVIMKQEGARILSGALCCGQRMILDSAGSPAGAPVTLMIEHIYDTDTGPERVHLQNAVIEARQVVRTIQGHMKRLTDTQTEIYKGYRNKIQAVEALTEKREHAYAAFRQWLTDPDMIYIDIRGKAYPGVTIRIEDRTLALHRIYEGQRFYYTHGGIASKPLNEAAAPPPGDGS